MSVNILNNGTLTPVAENYNVDAELNKNSTNPVQNKTVATAVENLNNNLGTLETALSGIKMKSFGYIYSGETTANTDYVVSNAKSLLGLDSSSSIKGFAMLSIEGNSNWVYNTSLFYNSKNDTLRFKPTVSNSSSVTFKGIVFYV